MPPENIKPLINGDDLIKLGIKDGKKIGKLLDKLLIYKIINPESFKSKEDEINWVVDIL